MKKELINQKKLMQFALSLCLILMSTLASWGQGVTQTAPGTYSYTVPAGVTSIKLEAWGAGGAGGSGKTGSSGNNLKTGGGAGGSYSAKIIAVTAGQTVSYTIGSGGTPSATGSVSTTNNEHLNASDGANSTVTYGGSEVLKAQGGIGGGNGYSNVATTAVLSYGGIAYTSGNTGTTNWFGGNGGIQSPATSSGNGGGGGGSAGRLGNGGAGASVTGGTAGTDGGATGGAGGTTAGSGSIPGSGGGGVKISAVNAFVIGGAGGAGKVVISYPIISKTGSFSSLSTVAGTASGSTSIGVTGADMQSAITATASAGFEVSSDNSTFSSSITSTATSGSISFPLVYVRLAASASAGSYAAGTVTFTATNAATVIATIPSSTVSSASVAAVTVSTTSLSTPFAKMTAGTNSAISQNFTVNGVNLGTNAITIAAPTHFKISLTDVDANYSSSNIVLTPSSGTVSNTTIYVKYSPTGTGNISGNSASVSITNASVASQAVAVSGLGLSAFYYNAGSLATLGSWTALSNGSGDSPADFSTGGITYNILSNATTDAPWTVSGLGSKIVVGNGATVTLTVANTFPIIGTIEAAANGSILWQDVLTSPTFGTLDNASEVHFQPATVATYALGLNTAYGKLFIDGAGKVSLQAGSSTATVQNSLTVALGSTLEFPVTNTHSITINAGKSANIYGTIRAGRQGGLVGTSPTYGITGITGVSILLADATSILNLGVSSTIDYFRTNAAQTISVLPTGVNYANLTLSENACAAATSKVIPTSGVTVNGTLTISLAGVAFASTTVNADKITLANGATIVKTLGTLDAAPLYLGTYNVTYNGTTAQTAGFELPTAASAALNNLTFDNAAGVTLGSATTGNSIIANKSNAITLSTADYLNANVQVNGASELTLNVNANQANLKKIVFSSATTAKLKLNMATDKTLTFTNSSAENWGTGTLEIANFQEGKIKFGNSNTALTLSQLGLIKDMGDLSKTFKLSDQGYLYYSTTIVPGDAFVVTSANPLYLAAGVASTYSITATNSPTNFVLADPVNSPLPAGLTLNATTGAIEGTPTVAVTNFVVPITLTNSVSTTNTINFTFNVRTRDPQTITWNQNFPTTNTYGDAAITLTATTSSPLVVSYTSSNTAVATISGSTLTIVGPGTTTVTAMQAGDADYAPATNLTKGLVVNAKSLTIAGATAMGKVYNKLNTATITGTLAGGIVGADVVTLVLSATYADANAGENKPVTSTSTLTGADAAKYSLTQPTGLFATITKADQLLAALGTSSFKILGDADYDPIPLVTDSNVTGVASVAIENPNFTYTSSNESVATIVGGKVHILGLGSTTITGEQAGSINYNASLPVSQTLKVLPVPLAAWDLYNFNPSSSQQSVTSVNASQVAAGISVTPSLSMGNMTNITNAGNRYRFTSSDWPYSISSGTVAPINIQTGKYMSVAITADTGKSLSLSSINASFRGGAISSELLSQFAYSIDNGVTFTAIGSPTTFSGISSTRFYSDIDLSGIAALQNLPSGTTVTLRYYASGKSNVTTSTANQKSWGFFSDFVQNNTRALIIGGSLITLPPPPTVNDQAFCTGTLVSALVATGTGIKWYANASTSSILNPSTPLTTGTYYASQTINGVESLRAAVFVTINNSVAGIISGNQTIITGTIPTNITLGNYNGSIQWQSSTNGVTFSNINGATNPTLSGATIGELTVNTYIRAVVTSGSCNPAISDVSTITITCCKYKFN